LINLSNSENLFKKPHVNLKRNSEKPSYFKNDLTFPAFLGGFRNYLGKKFEEGCSELLLSWNKAKTSYLIFSTTT
jgi:hypothetical protein